MTMTKTLAVFVLVAAVSGCVTATKGGYQASLDTLLGSSETEMILQFGPPVAVETEGLGGSLYWESERVVEQKSSSASGGISFGISTRSRHRCELRAFVEGGTVSRFEWRATRSAIFGDRVVDELHAGECHQTFSAERREPGGWSKLEPWIGRTEDELAGAYGKPPIVHDLHEGARLLSWSGTYMGRTATPQAPNIESEARKTRSCVVGFVVSDSVVTAADSWGDRSACPLPQ